MIIPISIVSISAEESLIPSWIENIARHWAADQISDSEFLDAMQHLIDNGSLKTKQTAEESLIPSWIKNIARHWAADQISDSEFLGAMQYLIDNGILKTKQTATEPIPPITQSTPITKQVKQYYPSLEDYYVEADALVAIFALKYDSGEYATPSGKYIIIILNSEGEEALSTHLNVSSDSYMEYTTDSGKKFQALKWRLPLSKFKTTATSTGEILMSFTNNQDELVENQISISNLPFADQSETLEAGFNTIKVDKIFLVGPFLVTIEQVGSYTYEEYGQAKEAFRVDVSIVNKRITDLEFQIDETNIIGDNGIYYVDLSSTSDLEQLIPPEVTRSGYILYEPIPNEVEKITLILRVVVFEDIDLSDIYKYQDELEISLK